MRGACPPKAVKPRSSDCDEHAASPALLHPPRRNRLERRMAACRASATFRSTRAGACRRAAAARSCATCWRATRSIRRSSISCRARSGARARRWNCCAALLGLEADAYRQDERLAEISFGALGRIHDRGIAPALARRGRGTRARQVGLHAARGGKLRHDVDAHARLVRRARARHGRGRAWRHVARAGRATRHRVSRRKRRSSISGRASST